MAKAKKWVGKVKTISTAPPKDLFTKNARTIAETMARSSVSLKGIGSGIRMIQYFINRGARESKEAATRETSKKRAMNLTIAKLAPQLHVCSLVTVAVARLRGRTREACLTEM